MFKSILFRFLIILILLNENAYSDIIKEFNITGNKRVSSQTIELFSGVKINQNIDEIIINDILKNLYQTNFFKDISVELNENILNISVIENPIIDKIIVEGVKAQKIKDLITNSIIIKPRSSFNQDDLFFEKQNILKALRDNSYYFAKVDFSIEDIDNNLINLYIKVNLGNKAKIGKITFIGEKIFKENKLKSLIISEEFKFWKFLSGKKYLKQEIINLDNRLLKNFYLNKGYYNVNINSSFAKLNNDDDFELIYNINANDIVYFGDIKLNLPLNFNQDNFRNLQDIFSNIKGEPYSLLRIEKIINEIEKISTYEEYESTSTKVTEEFNENKINLYFNIEDQQKQIVSRINILGNNVTRENVIRNQFEIDEGDPFNDILFKKSINNLQNLNFFKDIKYEIQNNEDNTEKIINLILEEKPTGEIAAGAGVGTSGGTIAFLLKENNYLGKGIDVSSSLTLNAESIKGNFNLNNPNFNNTDKSVNLNIQSLELDRLKNYGYKTNKTGFSIGTNFEYYDDLFLGFGTSNFYEKISTDSTASSRQQSQEGNYWDTFLNVDIKLDKRNQKYQTTDGYISNFSIDLPVISENNTLINSYDYKYFTELYENNVSSFSFLLRAANSISGNNIKLSERLSIPTNRLRGFEAGKVGPKDGNDYIGGNFISALNFSSTIPQIMENNQNIDIGLFLDIANIWSVDYDSSIDDGNQIRSALGLAFDWLTPVGPLSFTFSQPITKKSTDVTETFRFNIGTTF